MVRHALILAHRIVFDGGSVSPQVVAFIRRTLKNLSSIGIEEVCIIDGEQADELRERLVLQDFSGLRITVRANRTWRKASGASFLQCRDLFPADNAPVLVLRGDRPLDTEALAELASQDLDADEAVLMVASPQPELRLCDEVKVRLDDAGVVRTIGLDLARYDAVYTGHALVRPSLARELEHLLNPALEDGLAHVAARGRVRALSGKVAWTWMLRECEVDDQVDAILDAKDHPRYTLMNPGPVNTSRRVKSALIHHDISHRDSGFTELLVSLTTKLRRIFRGSPEHSVLMITGSGTAAMESAISSAVPRDRKILIIDNGAFGGRLLEVASLHEMDIVHLRYAWGEQVKPADVVQALDANPDIAVVAMVHHETSVGLLNPIREIGRICRTHDALLIVDAVSSLGAEDLDVVRDNIDICYGSANKCLHAVSGVGFLCVSPRAWNKIDHIKPRSYYLNLKRYRKYMAELGQTPFTPAVSAYFALDAACDEFLEDGAHDRRAMYRQRNEQLRKGLADLGMYPFTRTGHESNSVTTCALPAGVAFEDLYDGLKSRGYIVYPCKDELSGQFLQVANMGELDSESIDAFLATARDVIAGLRRKQPRAHAGTLSMPLQAS